MTKTAIAFAATALLSTPAVAQEVAPSGVENEVLGTVQALSSAPVERDVALGTIFASNVFSNAQYGTGAVGRRNRARAL